MAAIQTPLVPPYIAQLARRYVIWTERKLKQSLLQLRLDNLSNWEGAKALPEGLEIVPLSECGTEWLLRKVYNECAAGTPGFRPARHVDMISFSASPMHDRRGVFLAKFGPRYVGTCVGRVRSDGTGVIYSLSVHPEFRGKGIGGALLHAGLAYVRRRGAPAEMLYADSENQAALRLYEREGFKIVSS
jgi:mycothiol synthase